MKYSMVKKFLVIFLTACALVSAIAGTAGIVSMESASLYVNSVDSLSEQTYGSIAKSIATAYAERYAAQRLGDLPYVMREDLYPDPIKRSDADHWHITMYEGETLLGSDGMAEDAINAHAYAKTYTVEPLYPIMSQYSPDNLQQEEPEDATDPTTNPTQPAQESESAIPLDYLYYERQTSWEDGSLVTYYLYYYQAPKYTVRVYLQEDVLDNSSLQILTDMYPYRFTFIGILIAGLLGFAIGFVWLCWSAGRDEKGEINPGALNRLPLDLYAILAGVGIFLLILVFNVLRRWTDNWGFHPGSLSLFFVNLLAMVIIGLGLLYAFCAQIKQGIGALWRNMLLGRLCRALSSLAGLMPVVLQWLLTVLLLSAIQIAALVLALTYKTYIAIAFAALAGILWLAAILYGGYALGTLARGAQRMSGGDLGYKIPTGHLFGGFLTCAQQLNALSETAMLAAREQMKAERMRSELITNVSHDIKTPLTSIINFVDLLQKPHSKEQSQEYLEVLSRQSARMKKLIEDLMELSKASSGNIAVNLCQVDAAEAVHQALGEFADKLEQAAVEPVFHQPEQSTPIQADGRLLWRVLSNLLSNAVKYAMPGTRLYIDLTPGEDAVLLSIKNVSKAPLRIDAEELLERFVRGDVARHSEGSGLGLNIAKSLMEVQGGKLELQLDGDLFKVTLVFPVEK